MTVARTTWLTIFVASIATGASAAPAAPPAPRDSAGYTIPAGQEGAVFRSLTVEGEDRVHFDFERPALALDLDPNSAPGLDWGSAKDVLNRTVPDLGAPLLVSSSLQPAPWLAHPWLARFSTGAVARFHPDVKGVERWKLTIVDARGQTVAIYEGRGEPPREIAWDGRTSGGGMVVPGMTYSYVLEARDRAGNKRNFVGEGFQASAYRLAAVEDPVMVFSGRELPAPDPTRPAAGPGEREATAPILIEAAGWLNQSPKAVQTVRVTATARSADQAQALCALVVRQMAPHLLGDPARIQAVPEVQPDAPEKGAVRISAGR
ncbi:MAG TPA: hypothetical protein VJY35_11360 [Candidatus Eisenbacteria bacterium]|nr:hypothetical protein [Candidatus Eisenbacteria bacterium]